MGLIVNHQGGVGEIGKVFNHYVSHAIGWTPNEIVNHNLENAAPDGAQMLSKEQLLAKSLGLLSYPGRVLGATSPRDIIQFHPSLKKNWGWIKEHYKRVGLPHAEDIVWDDSFSLTKKLIKETGNNLSTFFFGKDANLARPDQNFLNVANEMNSKNNFMVATEKLGSSSPWYAPFGDREEVVNCEFFLFPLFLKIDVSVSGLGVKRCGEPDELRHYLDDLVTPGTPFQFQGAIEGEGAISITLLYRINNYGRLERLGANEQILEGYSHAGNRYPTEHQPWHVTDPIAIEMWKRGMKGHIGFNLIGIPGSSGYDYFMLECNPRYNGSSYPTLIGLKREIESWMARNYKTSLNRLDQLDLGEIEYNSRTKTGVIVFNWGCIEDGKLGIMIAGDSQQQIKIEEKLQKILN